MNIRKPIDYSAMYAALDDLMAAGLLQMELYSEIGRVINSRPEKGAAVIAAEYLQDAYPGASGFSPRNTRRMREFYRTYENSPALLDEAMEIGWTQNVVILEAELTLEEKAWYIRAVHRFGWTKLELMAKIADCAHETVISDAIDARCMAEPEPEQEPVEKNDGADPAASLVQNISQPDGGDHEEGNTRSHLEGARPSRSGPRPCLTINTMGIGGALDPPQNAPATQKHRMRRIRAPVRDGPRRGGKDPPAILDDR